MTDKNDLLIQIATLITTNNNGEVSAADIRTVLSAMVTADMNLDELTAQVQSGAVTFDDLVQFNTQPTFLGNNLLSAPVSDDNNYVMRNGGWVRAAAFIATSNQSITVSGNSSAPSFLPVQDVLRAEGVEVVSLAEGSFRNVSGRTIKEMTGTISFNPDKSGGGTAQLIIVSERSGDDGVTWQGNLNSIRKVEVSGSTESFQTKLSLVTEWEDQQILRFRAHETGGGSVDFIPTSDVILGQTFTGPSMAWELSEA